MANAHYVYRGDENNREFFDGEGGWWAERIDAHEYESMNDAAEAILKYKLADGYIGTEPVSSNHFRPGR